MLFFTSSQDVRVDIDMIHDIDSLLIIDRRPNHVSGDENPEHRVSFPNNLYLQSMYRKMLLWQLVPDQPMI